MLSFVPQSCAQSLDITDFPLSKLMACETSDFQNVLGDLIKCLEKVSFRWMIVSLNECSK